MLLSSCFHVRWLVLNTECALGCLKAAQVYSQSKPETRAHQLPLGNVCGFVPDLGFGSKLGWPEMIDNKPKLNGYLLRMLGSLSHMGIILLL